MKWSDYIDHNPEILSGKPILKGTRLSIEHVLGRLASGWTEEMVLESFPALDREKLRAIYAFMLDSIQSGLVYFPQRKSAA